MSKTIHHKRILLKISGEALASEGSSFGINSAACKQIVSSIQSVYVLGVQIAIVIGAGNFVRGASLCQELEMPQYKADQIGMLATIMNSMILAQALKNAGCPAEVLSAFNCGQITNAFSVEKADQLLNQNQIVIFAGGTGNPYFTTDTAASIRAIDIRADLLIKATKVDGVYDKDPKKFTDAKKYDTLTYDEILSKHLKVMDATAISLCKEHQLSIVVFNMYHRDNFVSIVKGNKCGTLVKGNH